MCPSRCFSFPAATLGEQGRDRQPSGLSFICNMARALPMRALLFTLLLLVPLPAMAQQTDEQLWLQTNAVTSLSENAKVTLEGVGRFSDRAGGFFHYEIGGMIGFTVAKGVELAGGYRHVQDYDHGAAKPGEERTRQQVTGALGGGLATPLGEKGVALFANHEAFINLNTTAWGQARGYERMRNAVGVTVPLSKKLKGDVGYLNQYRFGRGGARDQMDHAATFALTLNL